METGEVWCEVRESCQKRFWHKNRDKELRESYLKQRPMENCVDIFPEMPIEDLLRNRRRNERTNLALQENKQAEEKTKVLG